MSGLEKIYKAHTKFQFYEENTVYAQAAIKPNTLLRNGAYGIVMRGVQKCTCAGASLRGRYSAPLCCIKLDTATDCCCGSGGMLVQSEKFIEAHCHKRGAISVYGQEANPDTWKMAKMNMALMQTLARIMQWYSKIDAGHAGVWFEGTRVY